MDELFIKIKDLKNWDLYDLADYFNNKDIVPLIEILSAFDYELQIINKKLNCEEEWAEEDKQCAYECEQAEERQLQEYEGE